MVRRAGRCARGCPYCRGGLGLHGRVWRALSCDGGPDHRLPARGGDRLPGTDLSLVPLLGRTRSLERGEGPLTTGANTRASPLDRRAEERPRQELEHVVVVPGGPFPPGLPIRAAAPPNSGAL